jgi:hypothetical protein
MILHVNKSLWVIYAVIYIWDINIDGYKGLTGTMHWLQIWSWDLIILIKCMHACNMSYMTKVPAIKAKLFYFDIWITYMSYNYNHPVAARDWMQYIWNVELTMLPNMKINALLDLLPSSQYDSVPYIECLQLHSNYTWVI